LLYQEAKRLGLNDAVDLQWELELAEKEYLINKLLERVYSERIQISDQEIESYYTKNRELFEVKEDEARVLHISTKTKAEADFALQEIKAGKAFDKVAKERSIDVFRENGGDMGFIRRSDVIPEVARVCFNLPENGESPVFQSSYGYHIVRVLKKYRASEIKRLEDVKSDIVRRLRIEKERNAYYDYLVQIQNKSKVFIEFPKDRSMDSDSLGRSVE
jgi:parvulin-like peptidyl-prolyl isomerase